MHLIFVVMHIFISMLCLSALSLSSHLLPRNRLDFWPAAQPDLQPRPSAVFWPAAEIDPTKTIAPAASDIWPWTRPPQHPGSGYRRWRKVEVWAVAARHTADVCWDNSEDRWAQEVRCDRKYDKGMTLWQQSSFATETLFHTWCVLCTVRCLMTVFLHRTQNQSWVCGCW